MKYLLRPYKFAGVALLAFTAGLLASPPGALAQNRITHMLRELNPLLSHSSQGYLGVLVTDVDNDSVIKLKLKDSHGALITLIDHDAPAGPVLRVNDVVLSVNGQAIDSSDQFTRILREFPAGRKVTLIISRDGASQTITLQLVDRKKMEQDVWNKMNSGDAFPPPPSGMGILTGGGEGWSLGHMSPFGSNLNVGALVEPLTSQMAEYLGVQNGVMVKQVARKSEAATAGLKPFDVILKVAGEQIKTTADWDRSLRSNEGKQVPITILRDRKQQVINLQVDSKHRGEVDWNAMFPQGECRQLAQLDREMADDLLRRQMQEFQSAFSQEQIDQFRREAEQLRDSLKASGFPDLKIDPKQMQELQRQMEEFRKQFPQQFQFDRHQLDELQRQLEQFGDPGFGQQV